MAVHDCLGQPRSDSFPMRVSAGSEGGFDGLRIGKSRSRRTSDPGMEYDGMYWHYLDKWIFALARYAHEAGDDSALIRGIRLVKQVHPHFLARSARGEPLGLFWKMNVDLTTIPGRDRTGPNGDAVAGLIAYTALERTRKALGVAAAGDLTEEIADLTKVVQRYAGAGGFEMGTEDPLGFGLQFWEAQFYESKVSEPLRKALGAMSRSALNRRHFALPFRLYGGIIGARLSGDKLLEHQAVELLRLFEPEEMKTMCGEVPHSGINKVMFATALDPSAFARRSEEDALVL